MVEDAYFAHERNTAPKGEARVRSRVRTNVVAPKLFWKKFSHLQDPILEFCRNVFLISSLRQDYGALHQSDNPLHTMQLLIAL
jgi:hypothetical protein